MLTFIRLGSWQDSAMFFLDLFNIILYFIYHLPDFFYLAEELIHKAINIDGYVIHARIFIIALGLK